MRHSAALLHEALDTCQSVGVAPKNREKPGVLVPIQLGSALRAPYGWTSRMRREERWPERGETKAIHIGFWMNVTLALGVYGPYCLGAPLGLFFLGGWRGVAVGFLAGLAVQVALLLLIGPIFIALRGRRFS